MATVGEIYRFLDEKAPFALQLDFDNAGFLAGREAAEVSKILVALDITLETIEEAISKGAELIVSHHPLIWGKIASVTDQDLTGKKLLLMLEHKIAAICAHTNLDAVEGGVNSSLAERLGLLNLVPLHEDGVDASGNAYGIGRVGLRKAGETTLETFAQEVKQALGLSGLRFSSGGRSVHHVAVGGGACGSMLTDVTAHGCDTFVTSDLKHDIYLEAKALGINLIDAGHYSTETVICPVLQQWLQEAFPTITVLVSEKQGEVFSGL